MHARHRRSSAPSVPAIAGSLRRGVAARSMLMGARPVLREHLPRSDGGSPTCVRPRSPRRGVDVRAPVAALVLVAELGGVAETPPHVGRCAAARSGCRRPVDACSLPASAPAALRLESPRRRGAGYSHLDSVPERPVAQHQPTPRDLDGAQVRPAASRPRPPLARASKQHAAPRFPARRPCHHRQSRSVAEFSHVSAPDALLRPSRLLKKLGFLAVSGSGLSVSGP